MFYYFISEKIEQIAPLRTTRRICGILGTIKLICGQYLIVATHRLFVGLINGQVIWKLAGYDIIPYIPNVVNLNNLQVNNIIIILFKYLLISYWNECR